MCARALPAAARCSHSACSVLAVLSAKARGLAAAAGVTSAARDTSPLDGAWPLIPPEEHVDGVTTARLLDVDVGLVWPGVSAIELMSAAGVDAAARERLTIDGPCVAEARARRSRRPAAGCAASSSRMARPETKKRPHADLAATVEVVDKVGVVADAAEMGVVDTVGWRDGALSASGPPWWVGGGGGRGARASG